jgi:hypothetical protein
MISPPDGRRTADRCTLKKTCRSLDMVVGGSNGAPTAFHVGL